MNVTLRGLFAAFAVCLCTTAAATTNYVSPTGGNVSPYTSWATAAHDLQSAINVSSTGGTINVAAGTYTAVDIKLTNGILMRSASGAASTVLDAGLLGRCITTREGATLSGFTLTRGRTAYGGAMRLEAAGSAIDCVFVENTAVYGGAVDSVNGGPLINCTFLYNKANHGGAVYLLGSSSAADCLFNWNTASNRGGAVYMSDSGGGAPTLQDCTIKRNTARSEGGGVYAASGATILGCTIAENSGWTNGGGIAVDGDAHIDRCKVLDNTAGDNGGGIHVQNGTAAIYSSVIDNNSAHDGGGVYMQYRTYVHGCLITRNEAASWGGGVYSTNAGAVRSCTIVSNVVVSGVGGGIYNWSGRMTSQFNIVYFNRAAGTTSNSGGNIWWVYSCYAPASGASNIGADPGFVDRPGLDLRLRRNSPCVDVLTGSAYPIVDVTGTYRPLDGNNDGVIRGDVGAYERVDSADSDHDGFSDRMEISHHSNPTWIWDLPYALDDFNQNGLTDLAVYQRVDGAWFIRSLGPTGPGNPPIVFGTLLGGPKMTPVPGDFTGNGFFDLAVYDTITGDWHVRELGPSNYSFDESWGGAGMTAVSGDYNGDGAFDLAAYEEASGNWFIRKIAHAPPIAFGKQWGGTGLQPVCGDYDGNGVWDLAVYQTATGNWFIRSIDDTTPICFGQNWGGPGLVPVPGDFNGDGMWDLAVYQTATGNWFIRSLGPISGGNPPITFGQNWGGPGLEPVAGDFNGDGLHDLAVYQTATGNWFIRSLGPIGGGNPPICFGQNWGGPGLSPVGGL